MGRHNELDLGGTGSPLQLDQVTEGLPSTQPPPEIAAPEESGLDFPTPVGITPGESGLDLPSPVGMTPSQVRDGSNAYTLDLPAPVADSADRAAPRFAPPSAPRPSPTPPARPMPDFTDDLPVPVDLDLPTPAHPAAPSHAAPVVAAPDDRLDLPIPADLPTPGAQRESQEVRPAGADVRPAELGVEPANLSVEPANLSVEPANFDLEPKMGGDEVAPHDLPGLRGRAAAGVPLPVGPEDDDLGPGTERSDLPGLAEPLMGAPGRSNPGHVAAAPRPRVSKGVLIFGGVVLVLAVAGAGVMYSGILDPEDPQPASLQGRGIPKSSPDPETKVPKGHTPTGTVGERSSAMLAAMAQHTPTAYLGVRTTATTAGDPVAGAEAALLLHFHYGPNPPLVSEASAALQPYASATEPFVRRVVGLAALAAGTLEAADEALVGDGPRTRLYRGWLRLAQGKLEEAKTEAEAVLAAAPDDRAATHLRLAVAAQQDPVAAVSEIQEVAGRNPQAAAIQALLVTTALRTGRLAIARTALDAIDPEATADPGVKAWVHTLTGRVRRAQGDAEGALESFETALELVPEQPETSLLRIRTMLMAKRFNDASRAVSALVRERPNDTEVQLLQAEVAVQSGDGDIALQVLDKLSKVMPKDARVMYFKGEVHTMRSQVDEGQTAFAAARAFDPHHYRAAIGEAVLLADAKRLPDALAVLEGARTEAEAAGRSIDVARLLVAKAELYIAAGDTAAALEALDRALEADASDNAAQLQRGALRLEAGQLAEGRADLVAVFDRTGGYPGLDGPLGSLLVADGDYEGLERLVGDRLRGDQTPDALLIVGVRLVLFQGRVDEARKLIDVALTRRPNDWEAHMLLAQVLIAEGKPVEALAQIVRARPPAPKPELMLQRGKIFEFNLKHDEAVPEYRRALGLQPDLHEARFLYGRLLAYNGAFGKAIAELRKVLDAPAAASAPWFPEVWLNLGVAQHGLGKYADAVASLRKATSLDPKLGEAWAKEGSFHGDRNKHGDAIAALTKAVALGTKDDHWFADALMALARAQSKSGKGPAAKKTAKQFLDVAPAGHTGRVEAQRLVGGP